MFVQTISGSITRLLSDQKFTLPHPLVGATDFPKCATHAIDFGLGGLSGIGPLKARNLNSRGVCAIVAGGKGKGDID
jgi:fatty acid synthase subunit alpha